jgi:hypothetical protein
MYSLDLNSIFYFLLIFLGGVSLVSGAWFFVRSFIDFRTQLNRSLSMDLEIIRVSRANKPKEDKERQDSWKEEIGAMEQLLTAISMVKDKRGAWHRFLYDFPHISLEIANSSEDDEIVFFISMPKKFRENIEKQINSSFPNASLEKVADYTIFSPGSYTSAAVLKLKRSHILPIKTYEKLEVDPLNAIANALSKLETKSEGAAMQLILKPSNISWRHEGRTVAHKMQQGKRLKDVHDESIMAKIGKGTGDVLQEALAGGKKGDAQGLKKKPSN